MKQNRLGNYPHLPRWRASDWAVVVFAGVLLGGILLGTLAGIACLYHEAVR